MMQKNNWGASNVVICISGAKLYRLCILYMFFCSAIHMPQHCGPSIFRQASSEWLFRWLLQNSSSAMTCSVQKYILYMQTFLCETQILKVIAPQSVSFSTSTNNNNHRILSKRAQ